MQGSISRLNRKGAFGFISIAGDQRDAFFHATDLAVDLEFGERLMYLEVAFDVEAGPKGPRARNVRPARP
jgi:cold shock CspA family protein